ncbi:MAG TPA: SCO family protein [Candidatus Binataceae bacterium]|nr:SCO family protein [Candidatus Binataceae bacterium]
MHNLIRKLRWSVALVIAALALGALTHSMVWAVNSEAPVGSTFAQINRLPNIPLIDQSGHPTSLAALSGKPVLVGFIHTDCQGPCELMTARMKAIAQELEPAFNTKVTMVAVTTDPKEDHPAQLAAYAKAQGAEGAGWVFLTGKPDDVAHVLNLYGVPHGAADDEMAHVFELYLIGRDGWQLHQYHGPDIKAETVAADIRTALARR